MTITLMNTSASRCRLLLQSRKLSSTLAAVAKEKEILLKLKEIIDPVSEKSIGIGIIQGIRVFKESIVSIDLDFMVPGYPFKNDIVDSIRASLKGIEGIHRVDFSFRPFQKCANLNSTSIHSATGISDICHIIAVSSCKGGVGKSTVAANLAVSLSKMDLKVGLLDADVYGPSVPLMLPPLDSTVHRSSTNPKNVIPLRSLHCPELSMLSFGHVNPKSGAQGSGGRSAAVVRGPIVSRILNQLLLSTEWGHLDYLVVDMPPGTGDIQITLGQSASLSGAVIVTTPHTLSLADAAKGASMFEDLKVPLLAIVENMSYFVCDLGKRYYPFGEGGRRKLMRGFESLMKLRVDDAVQPGKAEDNNTYDRLTSCPFLSIPIIAPIPGIEDGQPNGINSHDPSLLPITITDPSSPAAKVYESLAKSVIMEVFKSQLSSLLIPSISYVQSTGNIMLRYFTVSQAIEYAIPKDELRMRDPKSGKRLINSDQMKSSLVGVIPTHFDFKGHYGVAINWSDGFYADIFPYDVLKLIAEEMSTSRS